MVHAQKYNLSLRWLLVALLLAIAPLAMAQVGRTPVLGGGQPGMGTEQVQLIHADTLNVLNSPGMSVKRVVNNVKFSHKGALLYCDLAIQNSTNNVIEAYGHVRIVQGDTVTVQGDTLYYYGNTRSATVLNRVVLHDRKMTLTTARLDYDMANGLAHYPTKGRIVDKDNVLTSEEGYYNTRSKEFTFIRNVRLVNPKTTLVADSLLYNSLTKIATFQGPTKITNKDGLLQARDGTYNTTTRVSNFKQRATAFTDKYTLTGDTLTFDNQTELGIAKGNVVMVSKEDKTTITGNQGRYNGKLGISRVTGNAVVRTVTGKDTMYMRADTLFSFDTPSGSKVKTPRKLIGQKNVLVFKPDMQSRCDSLVYTAADSSFYFYKKPIVWSQNYQMEADTITARLVKNRIHTLLLRSRSFVVSQDTMKFFNQIKGRSITANFKQVIDTLRPKVVRLVRRQSASTAGRTKAPPVATRPVVTTALVGPGVGGKPLKVEEKTQLDKVTVEGNGQSIYFVVDDKNVFTGMNRVDCSKMTLEFANSRVGNIWFYGHPDGILTPPKQLTEDKKKLDGFRWRVDEKPTRANVLGETPYGPPVKNIPQPPAQLIAELSDRVPEIKKASGLGSLPMSASTVTGLLSKQSLLVSAVAAVAKSPQSGSLLAGVTKLPVSASAVASVVKAPVSVSADVAKSPVSAKAVAAAKSPVSLSVVDRAKLPVSASAVAGVRAPVLVAAQSPVAVVARPVALMPTPTVVLLPDSVFVDSTVLEATATELAPATLMPATTASATPDLSAPVAAGSVVMPTVTTPTVAIPVATAPIVKLPVSEIAPVVKVPVSEVVPVVKSSVSEVVPVAKAPVSEATKTPAPEAATTKLPVARVPVAKASVPELVVAKDSANKQLPASVGAGRPNTTPLGGQAAPSIKVASDLEKVLNKKPLNKNGIKLDTNTKPFVPK